MSDPKNIIDLEEFEKEVDTNSDLISQIDEVIKEAENAEAEKESRKANAVTDKSAKANSASSTNLSDDLSFEDPEFEESEQSGAEPSGSANTNDAVDSPKTSKEKEYYERLIRLAADFENYKKRTNRDRSDMVKFANENMVRELLPVVDNFNRALEVDNITADSEKFLEGVHMIFSQFKGVLSKLGVKAIEPLGQPFDPNIHQAVDIQTRPGTEPNQVVEVFHNGYLLNDRLLRPAMVVVSSPQSAMEADEFPPEEELDESSSLDTQELASDSNDNETET